MTKKQLYLNYLESKNYSEFIKKVDLPDDSLILILLDMLENFAENLNLNTKKGEFIKISLLPIVVILEQIKLKVKNIAKDNPNIDLDNEYLLKIKECVSRETLIAWLYAIFHLQTYYNDLLDID